MYVDACDLHYWYPRNLPDAAWYEQMYRGRDQKLADQFAPRRGQLLDIGCGTGNFLVASCAAGYDVTGTELDGNAAKYASEQMKLDRIYPLTAAEFAEKNPGATFDVVAFFEVLEHQARPADFICNVRNLVRRHGLIALSVPNRERWLTGPDVLDFPPNYFLRWNASSRRKFLGKHGFEVLRVREQPAGIRHTAEMLNMATRTGFTHAGGVSPPSFRDITQMERQEAATALAIKPTLRTAGRLKHMVCFLLACAAYPYVRLRRFKGTYLYCLARRTG
jgi:SAM-dependent methyltransferase